MKIWSIDEFISECENLCKNQYTYDSANMPEGICNGHHVGIYENSWHSIFVDGKIENLTCINDKYPEGYTTYCVFNKENNETKNFKVLDYLRYILSR